MIAWAMHNSMDGDVDISKHTDREVLPTKYILVPGASKYAGVTCHAFCDPGRHCCLFGVLMRDIYLIPG